MQLVLLSALIVFAGAHLDHSQLWNASDSDANGTAASTPVAPVVKVSPVGKVVRLLADLQRTVETDGDNETIAYDKFACWCEDTLKEKVSDIARGTLEASTLQTSITKLAGQLASVTADVKQLKVDIADNTKSQADTAAIRAKENTAYLAARTEAEKCIVSLENAINNLAGAGGPKTSSSFLATGIREAKVSQVLSKPALVEMVSYSDLAVLREFARTGSVSAMQVDEKDSAPGGDYAPASEKIQGILKGMYDGFTKQQEKDNGDESNKQKAYEALKATQNTELAMFKLSLQASLSDQATKASEKSQNKNDLAATEKTLAANEKFLALTKKSCKSKALAWNERSRLRTEELQGFTAAIEVLNSSDAQSTFQNAANTFLQHPGASMLLQRRARQSMLLQVTVSDLTNVVNIKASTQNAGEVFEAGHFDSIAGHLGDIDKMVRQLADESKKDVDKKISCLRRQKANEQAIDDVQTKIRQMSKQLGLWVSEQTYLTTNIAKLNVSMAATTNTIAEMKAGRLAAMGEFEKATNDDLAAIGLLDQSTKSLSKFYDSNSIGKTHLAENDDAVDPKPRGVPEDGYGGQKSASAGIVAIIEMITSDLKGEVKDGRREDAEAEIAYSEDLSAADTAFQELKKSKAEATVHKAAITRKLAQYNDADMPLLATDNENLEATKAALATECKFLVTQIMTGGISKTEFQTNIDNRKAEKEGLVEAKTFLNGATVLQ